MSCYRIESHLTTTVIHGVDHIKVVPDSLVFVGAEGVEIFRLTILLGRPDIFIVPVTTCQGHGASARCGRADIEVGEC